MTARNRRTRKQTQARAEARKRRGTSLDLFTPPKPRPPKPKAEQSDGNATVGTWGEQADRAMVRGNGGGRRLLFVYGTLKSGYGLAGRLPYKRIPATVRGRVYQVSHGGYPVLDIREDGWVAGEIVCVPSHAKGLADLDSTLKMEQGAGYTIRETQALLPNESTWRTVLVCAWENDRRGERVAPTVGHRLNGDRTEDAANWTTRWEDDDPEPTPSHRARVRPASHYDDDWTASDWPEGDDDEWRGKDGSCLICDAFTGHDADCPVAP